MTDIAVLGLEVRSDGVVVASNRLQQLTREGRNAENSTSKLSSATSALTGYLKAAAAAFGLYKLAEYAKESALLAARYQTLGVVMNTVGATAGYTNAQMAGFEKTLQKQGIAMVESRQVLTQMAQAHLDLGKASELARVAQDAATIGGINSSEAFERMVSGIQKGETEILKTIGINVNFEQSYNKMALTLGKSRDALTENEKSAARMNSVLERGKDIAGVYEAAMGTAGKQLTSMKRYIDNLKVTAGSVFNDILIVGVQAFTGVLKEANTEAEKLQQQNKLAEWGQRIVEVMAVVADGVTIVVKSIYSLVSIGVAGFTQLYHAAESFSFALIGDFKGAKESFNEMLADGSAWFDMMKDTWSNPTMYQDAAKAMYAQREANKEAEAAKAKQLEQQRLYVGEIERAKQLEEDARLKELAGKKKSNELTQEQIAEQQSLNALLQRENELREISKLKNDQFVIIQQQIDIEKAQGLDQQAFEHQKILDLEKAKFEYQQKMIEYQSQLNTATEEEGAIIQRNMQLLEQMTAASMQAIQSRQYQMQAAASSAGSGGGYGSSWGYDGNGNLVNPSSRMGSSSSGGVDGSGFTGVRNGRAFYGGMDTSSAWFLGGAGQAAMYARNKSTIEGLNVLAAAMLEAEEKARAAAAAEAERVESLRKAQIALNDDITVREYLIDGLNDEAERYKMEVSQRNELIAAQEAGLDTTRLVAVQQAEYNKLLKDQELRKVIEDTQDFFDTVNDSLREMARAGESLVDSLTRAAQSLREASDNLLIGATSTLSPEQQYEQSRTQLAEMVQAAMSSGDATMFAQIPSLIATFLEQSQGYNASGEQYALDFAWAQDLLDASATAAEIAAANAEDVITAAEQQQITLDAIQEALTTGNTAALPLLLAELSSDNGALASAMAATTAALGTQGAIATGLTGLNTTTGQIPTSVDNSTTSLAAWLAMVNQSTGTVSTGVNGIITAVNPIATNTGNTASRLSNGTSTADWLSAIRSNSGKLKSSSTHVMVLAGNTYEDTTYTYYKKGGIANDPTGHSIFGEAGPEAAVPLPDGRTIPVTLYGAADNRDSETVEELKKANAELRAAVRVLQSGFSQLVENTGRQARSLNGIENKARLAANQ